MKSASAKGRVELYQDASGQWRWRSVSPNGRKVSSSGEDFDNRSNALRAARKEAKVRGWPVLLVNKK